MPLTNTWDKKLLKALITKTTLGAPTDVYIGLSTSTPSQVRGTGSTTWNFTEPSGDGYSRKEVANTSSHWEAITSEPTDGYALQNTDAITFTSPTGSWGTVTYFGIFTHSTGHTATYLIAFGELTTAKAIGSGDTPPSFAAKSLQIKLV